MRRLFKQFSFPGGIPSHVAPETPGSIHEGGELGYSLSHAFGAAFDNPDLLVCCVVGDGEAETGPLATSWHSNKFLSPVGDGAVLPILHLNGYKIAGPTVLARIPHDELDHLLRGYGWAPRYVEGSDPLEMHQRMAATLDEVVGEIQGIQAAARSGGFTGRPIWPMIVLRSPKGWTGPKVVDGDAHRGDVPRPPGPARRAGAEPGAPRHARGVDEELPAGGALRRRGAALSGAGRAAAARGAAHGRQPARQRRPAPQEPPHARLPRLRGRRARARRRRRRGDARPGEARPRRARAQPRAEELPGLQPGRDGVEPLGRRLRRDQPRLHGGDLPHGRPPGARRPGDGDAQRAPVPGLAGGLPAHRPPRVLLLLRGVHPHRRLDVQPARQVAQGDPRDPLAALPSPRSTTCSRRTCGGRITTASATRIQASSTTWSTRRPT